MARRVQTAAAARAAAREQRLAAMQSLADCTCRWQNGVALYICGRHGGACRDTAQRLPRAGDAIEYFDEEGRVLFAIVGAVGRQNLLVARFTGRGVVALKVGKIAVRRALHAAKAKRIATLDSVVELGRHGMTRGAEHVLARARAALEQQIDGDERPWDSTITNPEQEGTTMTTNESTSAAAAETAKAPRKQTTKQTAAKPKPSAPKRSAGARQKKPPLSPAQVKREVKKGMAQAKAAGAKARGETAPKPRLGDQAIGTKLRRTFKGKEIVVEVTAEGFVYEGKTYGSISGLARSITGYMISGPVFFGLVEPKQAAKKSA